ncbi:MULTISPECIES: 3-deoxy-8-phosphooctulonate synthase [Myxococcus]|uniref:3-deoxy-8-phosphooctulonate synthase n=1 Tax=Myxococcus xanthus TaxID=34 RepID=A0AAE6FX18_MYXXA|nr:MULTISPECIES: 3-deoxy-8-phosphooctulonate synthase [Myxococcus]QDE66524.1 3-deoxy-8-phosphooctulonate synthase [Myxococcus xanthus]QDE73797.1 3-deoxy-8-phosphooctulonate synthase [Myxococcus xanthus]QDE81058.1 3-deoxy-8-phosphooctulonate synthase [Myxococcus xanthus]QDE95390.1 3-deoxy-8-phosphooctulonate synthase [Myxococcus xanthus]QDF02674.1 3-deoxy-8-phosphooctulonate synthase [Myxococcus xanthus]
MSTPNPIELCGFKVGQGQKLFVIAGPDSIESEDMALRHAWMLKEITGRLGVPYAFKCSYDKANRTSGKSFRGPGLKEGLRILKRIRDEVGVPVLTDVHETSHVGPASEVVDIIQIPAFLCRQTDLVEAVARTGKGVNLKKGQFVAPKDIVHSARKAFEAGNPNVLVTERGSTFGYNNLVVDMRGFAQMRDAGLAVCFDATHSVQLPSAGNGETAGERRFVSLLARSAAAAGIDALFTEVHEDPDRALCDGPCSLNPQMFEDVVRNVLSIRRVLGHEPG